MKYFLIAGEASGDLHASHLMRALKEQDPGADFRYFGGDLMQAEGGTLLKHYREMAFMGFIPVLLNLRTIFKNLAECKQAILAYRPDKLIFVDYPGFNLKIAKWLSKQKLKHQTSTIYYISPKLWAWKTYRVKAIKRYIDRMLCILPFEVDFYKRYNYKVEYVGNPTVDEIAPWAKQDKPCEPVIALLAGSRKQEIAANLPAMLEAAAPFDRYRLVIAGAPGIDPHYYTPYLQGHRAEIVFGQTYALLHRAEAALVTSGTATLETALLRTPQVVCYKMEPGWLVSFLFKHFFSCRYISLVNLIAGRRVVQELFGKDFSVRNIRAELERILRNATYRQTMEEGYNEVIEQLGQPGAARKAAEAITACPNTETACR